MPIKISAKKALRQSQRRSARNLKRKKEMKEAIKKFAKFVAGGKTDEAKKIIPMVYKAIDKAAKIAVLKKNTASRKKSSLMRILKTRSGK